MWLVSPESCLSAQESGVWTLGSETLSESQAEKLASSVMWRSKLSAPRTWQRRWKRGGWIRRLSGATSRPSTDDRGLEKWISSLPGIPANPSAPPGSEGASTTRGTYGPTSTESSKRPEPRLSSSRTSEATSLRVSGKFSGIFPASGSLRSGTCSPRKRRARLIAARGSSFLPTLTVKGNHNKKGLSERSGDGLATAIAKILEETGGRLPTLTARDWRIPGPASLESKSPCLNARAGGPLNPRWCEAFMGFETGWTESEPSETP